MSNIVFAAGLMLVLEGILPLLVPSVWRDTFIRMVRLTDGQLRFMGLASMLAGLVIMFFALGSAD